MPFVSPVDLGLPVWPLPLVAALSLVAAAGALTLGVRDLLQVYSRKPSEKDRDQTR
jgi:hypothetical protein